MQNKLLLIAAFSILFCRNITFAQAPNLGAAAPFVLFTASGAFNGDPATSIVGDIGTNVGAYTPPGFLVGNVHLADPVSAQAAADVAIAYGYLAGLTCGSVLGATLGNSQTLAPNIYCIGSAAVLNGNLILDGGGNPGAIFIFQIDGALSTNTSSSVTLINGANTCNVYFQINGAFNAGGGTAFRGTIIAAGALNFANGASLIGRGLSTAGAISTSANVITLPAACNCNLDISCPPANGGNFQCISQIPIGTPANVTVNSSCGTPTVTISNTSTGAGCPASPYVLTRKYRVTDTQGHAATCTVTYTAIDNIAPTISCPAPVTVTCASLVPTASTTSVVVGPDNCGGAPTVTIVGNVISNQTCANRFTIARTYRVTDACGNSATCSQIITVLDNTAPTITCPAAVTVQCVSLVPPVNIAGVTVGADNCGGTPVVTFVGDVISNQSCVNRFTITRTYQVTDVCGNSATCAQIITVFDNIAPTFISPPANVTVECLLVPPVATPTATDNCTGPVTVVFLGQVQITGICPVLYTLNRSWRATDACGNSSVVTQIVTVVDNIPPQFTNNPVDVILECDLITNPNALQDWLNNHGGATAFDCSAVTWTFMNLPFSSNSCGGTFRRNVRFIATDACGNSSFQDASFSVVDFTPPTFDVLPQDLKVECWPTGDAEAALYDWLDHFGNAEVSDQCGSVTTSILFLSETQGCGETWSRIYQFRATDECGNTNFATATFSIVDTTPPVIITCPPGGFLTCIHDVPPPDLAGVIATDNCGSVHISVTVSTSGVGCKYWPLTVSYWYMATDECGNMVSNCDQSFQVVDTIAPFYNGPDTIFVACVDDLPASGQVMGLLMPLMLDNCYDFTCVGNVVGQNGPNSITYTMVAKDFCGNVAGEFTVTFIATGVCKPLCTASQATWGNPGGLIGTTGTTAAIEQLIAANGAVTAGGLNKLITADSAECVQKLLPGQGNTFQFSAGNYLAGNCQLPAKLLNIDGTLKNELAANVMAMQLNIWYNQAFNDRNLGLRPLLSLPDCLVDPAVLNKLAPGHLTVQGLLDLSNDYLAGVGFFPPGFGSLLNTALEGLNNYWQNCPANPTDPCPNSGPNATVAGTIATETGLGLEAVGVDLVSSGQTTPPSSLINMSSPVGNYIFSDAVPMASNLTVTPAKDDNPLNGVSTFDLVLINWHILGLQPLGSPYQMIAADANKSGSITTFDILELRKLILGIYQELPNNTSWRFVDKAFVFPNPGNAFQTLFPEYKTMANIQASALNNDFVAVKIGDLNQSAIANVSQGSEDRTTGTLLLDVDDREVKAGESVNLTFQPAEATQGYQFTLNLNGLQVTEIEKGDQVDASNFGVFDDALTVSVDGARNFTVKFRATKSGRLSTMLGVSSRITQAEAYMLDPTASAGQQRTPAVKTVALRFHGDGQSTIAGLGFELYQNQPNPFVDKTSIGFHLPARQDLAGEPEATAATLTVYDATGKLVYTQKGDYAPGYNTITIENALQHTAGLLYYKLETATDMAIRRMIQLK